ncbi:Zinc finger and SCAN domain-containing protein 29 [Chelonia mydas]|uniref:Zinc finger and SCAN domain-containing protein 29 n=1 Tax=Chelonia mydas TaxID=8469 RepID=M7BXJ7_CHEMY|nr:Zinc finger and SCAN domain-containing protein 29 [Chelonia mydas]
METFCVNSKEDGGDATEDSNRAMSQEFFVTLQELSVLPEMANTEKHSTGLWEFEKAWWKSYRMWKVRPQVRPIAAPTGCGSSFQANGGCGKRHFPQTHWPGMMNHSQWELRLAEPADAADNLDLTLGSDSRLPTSLDLASDSGFDSLLPTPVVITGPDSRSDTRHNSQHPGTVKASSSAQVTMQYQNRKRAPAWTEREVLDLIAVWGEESVLSELCAKRRNAKTFQKISKAMRDRGYRRDATQCRVKLKELRQVYQKTKESNRCSGTEPQTCLFYAELHAILGGAATTTPPQSMDSDDGVLSTMPEDFVDGEDEEEDELEESTHHTILPDSQDLFITLTEIPSVKVPSPL